MDPNQLASSSANSSRRGSRLIGRVLPPAVRFWLHTQLDAVESLHFHLNGRDSQILKGYIPAVSLSATQAVYQGLHMSQVQAEATEIYINLGQVLRGQPLRLLQPFPVRGRVRLNEAAFNASLRSPLLVQALKDLLARLWQAAEAPLLKPFASPEISIISAQLELREEQLQLEVITSRATTLLTTGLAIREAQILVLNQPSLKILNAPAQAQPYSQELKNIEFDLGDEVAIEALSLKPGVLEICGRVRVVPGD